MMKQISIYETINLLIKADAYNQYLLFPEYI